MRERAREDEREVGCGKCDG